MDLALLLTLILLPLLAALACWKDSVGRISLRLTLPITAALHFAGALWLFYRHHQSATVECTTGLGAWIGLDQFGAFFLLVTSALFLLVTIHCQQWLPAEQSKAANAGHAGSLQNLRVFLPCLLIFLATMTLVISAQNLGLLWVAVEATTLSSAPLILFHRSGSSLEAMWKYLLICSVGIGLALFGTMLLAISAKGIPSQGLNLSLLQQHRHLLQPGWFKVAFIFILVGYGTKMGLAPFHTWLPDAHSEAPGVVSALLSGALLNCSFLGIMRVFALCPEAVAPFARQMFTALGMLSLLVALFFIIHQSDYKRMLAYSSVEHMGLAALMCGLGVAGEGLALIHLCSHSLIKMGLFLLAGNFLLAYGTRQIHSIGGAFGAIPRTAFLWLVGIMMICGMPPSPLFVTELKLLSIAPLWQGCIVFLLLFGIFAGMTHACLKLCMGKAGEALPTTTDARAADNAAIAPALALGAALIAGMALLYFFSRI